MMMPFPQRMTQQVRPSAIGSLAGRLVFYILSLSSGNAIIWQYQLQDFWAPTSHLGAAFQAVKGWP